MKKVKTEHYAVGTQIFIVKNFPNGQNVPFRETIKEIHINNEAVYYVIDQVGNPCFSKDEIFETKNQCWNFILKQEELKISEIKMQIEREGK